MSLNEIGKGHCGMKMGDDMDMIFDPVDSIDMAVMVFQYPCHIAIKLIAFAFRQCSLTVLCPENNLIQDLGECTHAFY